eukprot:TRINITY_DN12368_c0_g1_i7.p1 TRINITY_DN12368_c0_g1~~TRINITY_DN12368_c0_g1_i7.p1  ORF type:complete len:616 (-),score=98.59 TRINITY_DN12368_c0_g1_i7:358-2205(-)
MSQTECNRYNKAHDNQQERQLSESNNVVQILQNQQTEQERQLSESKNVVQILQNQQTEQERQLSESKNVVQILQNQQTEQERQLSESKNVVQILQNQQTEQERQLSESKNAAQFLQNQYTEQERQLSESKNVVQILQNQQTEQIEQRKQDSKGESIYSEQQQLGRARIEFNKLLLQFGKEVIDTVLQEYLFKKAYPLQKQKDDGNKSQTEQNENSVNVSYVAQKSKADNEVKDALIVVETSVESVSQQGSWDSKEDDKQDDEENLNGYSVQSISQKGSQNSIVDVDNDNRKSAEQVSQSSEDNNYTGKKDVVINENKFSSINYKEAVRSGVVRRSGLSKGKNNCFMNAIVQCLWHCMPLRQAFIGFSSKCEFGSVLFQLGALLRTLSFGMKIVSPEELRRALGDRFKFGQMNDASEMYRTLLELVLEERGGDKLLQGLLNIGLRCKDCGKEQELVRSKSQNLVPHVLQKQLVGGCSLAELIIDSFECQETVECSQQRQIISGKMPQVVSLEILWKSGLASADEIESTMKALKHNSVLNFDRNVDCGKQYQISCFVFYYGKHYVAIVRDERSDMWIQLDDEKQSTVGNWGDLVDKCKRGRLQAKLIFFELEQDKRK